MSEQLNTLENSSDEKKKSKKDALAGLDILEKPARKLPSIIEETLNNNISVELATNGYYVSGFYGINSEKGKTGYAFIQETSEPDTLVAYDNKGAKHVLKNFEDLVKFHSHIWGTFFKLSEDYRKPDMKWFPFLLQYNALNITPSK
jgi:hypothetical protein